MKQRWLRIERLGMELGALVDMLEVTHDDLARWLVGLLGVEQSDVIEVGLAMLEMRNGSSRTSQNAPTLRLVAVTAA
jgi:hypothetical protein